MRGPTHTFALLCCLALASCTSDDFSFVNYTSNPQKFAGASSFPQVKVTDADVIRYSSHVAAILRARATGSRVARQASSSTQVVMAGLAGTSAAFNFSKSGQAVLGLGSALIPEFQSIFNAKGRAEAYTDAVRLIETSQNEYLSLNQDMTKINSLLTQNGVTLLQVTQASIHVVEKTLAGRIPSVIEMEQATERMSRKGATSTAPGTSFNFIGADGDGPGRRAQINAAIDDAVAKMTKLQPVKTNRPIEPESLTPTEWQARVDKVSAQFPNLTNAGLMNAYNAFHTPTIAEGDARVAVAGELERLRKVTLVEGKVPPAAVTELKEWEKQFNIK